MNRSMTPHCQIVKLVLFEGTDEPEKEPINPNGWLIDARQIRISLMQDAQGSLGNHSQPFQLLRIS